MKKSNFASCFRFFLDYPKISTSYHVYFLKKMRKTHYGMLCFFFTKFATMSAFKIMIFKELG